MLAELLEWSAMLSELGPAAGGTQVKSQPQADLRRAAALAQRAGVTNVLTCLAAGDPVDVILNQTRQTNADLLVIGRGRAPHALGETAAALVNRCPCTVMIAGSATVLH